MSNMELYPPRGDPVFSLIIMMHDKSKVLHRIKIIKGHITAIEKMIEDDRYCLDIVHQSQAVQKALKNLDAILITDHINHCVIEQAKLNEYEKIASELIKIYEFKK